MWSDQEIEDAAKMIAPIFGAKFGDNAWYEAQALINEAAAAGQTDAVKIFQTLMRRLDPRAVRDIEIPEIEF